MKIIKSLHQRFCKHEWELCREEAGPFLPISGEQIYRRCQKCGKVEKAFFQKYEGGGYK